MTSRAGLKPIPSEYALHKTPGWPETAPFDEKLNRAICHCDTSPGQ